MANIIAPAGMHILCIALHYIISQTSLNILFITFIYLSHLFKALVLFLGFQYFELQNIYEQITNSVVRSFIDSGAGLVPSVVHFSLSIEQRKQVYNCEANDVV